MTDKNLGILLNQQDISLHLNYFIEMTSLLGIKVIYRAPKEDKHYTTYGEIDTNFYAPSKVGCIFEEHPTVKSMRKLGWNSENTTDFSIIHVPYNLEKLQKGGIFILPDPFNPKIGRVFRVIELGTIYIYPASVACKIVPEFENTLESSVIEDFSSSNFNLLKEED